MNKNTTFLIAIIVLVIIIILSGILLLSSNKNNGSNTVAPPPSDEFTISDTPQPTSPPLNVISTRPENGSTNIAIDTKIIVSFNRIISADEIEFSISPATLYQQNVSSNTIVVNFDQLLQVGVTYTFVIKTQKGTLGRTYSFTTLGPPQTFLPDTNPGLNESDQAFQIQNHPDVYLSNQTPFATTQFAISSEFKTDPSGHFAFTLILKGSNKDAAKEAFIDWLISIGLTDDQIGLLDISYR